VNKPTRHLYDAIVLGSGVGASLTAALLAQRSLSVLQIPHSQNTYQDREFIFSNSLMLLPRVGSSGILETALSTLSLTHAFQRHWPTLPVQLLEKGHWRQVLPLTAPKAIDESAPADADDEDDDPLQQLVLTRDTGGIFLETHSFPPEGMWERFQFRNVEKNFTDWQKTSPLGSSHALAALASFVAPVQTPDTWTQTRTLSRWIEGPLAPALGPSECTHLIQNRARELGADVLSDQTRVSGLAMEGNKTIGIQLQDTVYRGATVISGLPTEQLVRLLPPAKISLLQKTSAAKHGVSSRFVVHAIVSA
jgi:hypothetical protein